MSLLRYLPNALTMCNLLCGCLGIWYGLHGEVWIASILVLCSAFFDFLDGLAARLTGHISTIGKDLDSLADVVSFGVSPAMLTLSVAIQGSDLLKVVSLSILNVPILFVLLLPIASAYRLAVFNHDDTQTHTFKGLPTPANGIFWAFFALGVSNGHWGDFLSQKLSLGVLALLFSWLMISRISLLSLKGVQKKRSDLFPLIMIVLGAIPSLLIFGLSGLALIVVCYIAVSVIANWQKKA